MNKTALISLFFIFFSSIIYGQNEILPNLLLEFYDEVAAQNKTRGLTLVHKIDSVLLNAGPLEKNMFITYLNAKGFIYYLNNLNPEPYLTKADSLNNTLPIRRVDKRIYSSYVLANYFFNHNQDDKARIAFNKIVEIDDIPIEYVKYKSEALDKIFFIDRVKLNSRNIDSSLVQRTAKKVILFKKNINDTVNLSYARALSFLNKNKEAEGIFLDISDETNRNSKYNKFQALNWLNNYYYANLKKSDNAFKQIKISESLLKVVEGTDFLELHNIYAIYGDLLLSSIVTDDKERIKIYEQRILNLIEDSSYLKNSNLNLNRFYYTIHKIKMYFDEYENYEKAKYYASKNVELTKYLYGEVSINHEQELLSLENIIKLKMFDYEKAYQVSLKREKIIKQLYTEDSKEYIQLLMHQHHIFLSQFNYKKCLEISEKAMVISEKINCTDSKLCDDVLYIYLDALISNKQFKAALEKTNGLTYELNISRLLRISRIRRTAYYELKNYNGVNFEFEWVEDQISNKKKSILTNRLNKTEYINFLIDYQEHLRTTGRLYKALSLSEENMTLLSETEYIFLNNKWKLNYLNILLQLNKCSEVLKYVQKNEVLKFNNISTPQGRIIDQNSLMNILGRTHDCIGDFERAIESYRKIIKLSGISENYSLVLLELSNLYTTVGNEKEARKYQKLFEADFELSSDQEISQLTLLVDFYLRNKNKEKVIEYLLPLSNKVINDICSKSYYSSEDNNLDKILHDDLLRIILTTNNSEYYNPQLSVNAEVISNLYKKKIDFYGEINLGIQKLENNNDAIELKKLKKQFNSSPTSLLNEEINQLISKLIGSRVIEFNDLCKINFNSIFNSLNQNELLADLTSYNQPKYNVETYTINFNSFDNGSTVTEIFLEQDKLLQSSRILKSTFFDTVFSVLTNKYSSNNIDTLYIIPSGKSNLINFSALSLALEEKLGSSIKVHVINSIADIPKIKNQQKKSINDLLLIGDIDFNKTVGGEVNVNTSLTRGLQLTSSIDNSGIPLWGYLPGTKEEIESIEALSLSKKINTSVLSDNEATETNIKNFLSDSKENSVLHIATHGYFFPDNSDVKSKSLFATHQNPLLRSGLILSGANNNWNNKTLVNPNNDGILTAEEISFMDLSKVELVVLSACDTGLGDISNLEGVNGLQRAFKLAGANKLIMSLWKVPDKETAEFFKHFYKFLLEDKLSINESFRETQKMMSQKYEPYYWASFVLLE